MNDLLLKYKSETEQARKDIDIDLLIDDEGEIKIDKWYLCDSDLQKIGMSDGFIAAQRGGGKFSETLTIIDPDYITWLESKLT